LAEHIVVASEVLMLFFFFSGIVAACLVFLVFCATQMRDTGFMKRPHPVVWRVVKGTSIIYLVGCIWFLFQVTFPRPSSTPFLFIASPLFS